MVLAVTPPSKEQLKNRLNAFDPEQSADDRQGVPQQINPCDMCRLNVTATDRSDKTCPNLNHPEKIGFDCQDLEIEKDTNHHKIAALLKRRNDFLTLEDTDQLLVWQDGIYQPGGDIVVKQKLEQFHGKNLTTNTCNEIIGHVQRSTYVKRDLFDENPNLITLENGVLNLETGLLNNWNPGYKSRVKIPVLYDPEATCPVIHQFFTEIVDPQDVPKLYEFVGYCLETGYPIQKAFMLIGGGENGKGAFLALIDEFLGAKNVSHESLHNLVYRRFNIAQLDGKLANIGADLSNITLATTGVFKSLCGGDRISVERKHQHPFDLLNRAKLIFATNTMPRTKDKTPAYYRRWEPIIFPNTFPQGTADPHILAKLTTPTELSGLLNKAIEALHRLRITHRFTNTLTTNQLEDYINRLSEPVYAFIEDRCEYSTAQDAWTSKHDLYAAFADYCRHQHIAIHSQTAFTKELKFYTGQRIRETRRGTRGWHGIQLKSTNEATTPPDQTSIDDLFPGAA
jgi:putative DNA primase/helicase